MQLAASAVKSDSSILIDEARALSFTGGRRVIRVRDAVDGVTPAAKEFLSDLETADDVSQQAFVIFEAGNLGPRSTLRKAFEAAKAGAALPCYADNARDLTGVVNESLAKFGLSVDPDARAYLVQNLGSDRQVSRMELEKLALYVGGDSEGGGRVTVEDAMACVGDSAAMSMDDVVFAACSGDRAGLDRALDRAFVEGIQPIVILRAATRHLHRLHLASNAVANGMNPDQAMKSLRPPVMFMHTDRFLGQLRQWRPRNIGTAMELMIEAELDCKTTGLPAEAMCGRALMRVAQAARQR